MLMTVATCWFLKIGARPPSHSASVTRMILNSSCVTVITITTKAARAMAAPYTLEIPKTFRNPAMPLANRVMATAVDVVPPAVTATETASSDSSPRVNSLNIAPPPTGSMSSSLSICRAVLTEPISACQPEIAPQAMVTKSIGHRGWIAPLALSTPVGPPHPTKAGMVKVETDGLTKNARNAPSPPTTMVSAVIQKPM